MSDKAQAEQIESALTPIADMKGDIGFCRLGPKGDVMNSWVSHYAVQPRRSENSSLLA